jgi:hypothetical protein
VRRRRARNELSAPPTFSSRLDTTRRVRTGRDESREREQRSEALVTFFTLSSVSTFDRVTFQLTDELFPAALAESSRQLSIFALSRAQTAEEAPRGESSTSRDGVRVVLVRFREPSGARPRRGRRRGARVRPAGSRRASCRRGRPQI